MNGILKWGQDRESCGVGGGRKGVFLAGDLQPPVGTHGEGNVKGQVTVRAGSPDCTHHDGTPCWFAVLWK